MIEKKDNKINDNTKYVNKRAMLRNIYVFVSISFYWKHLRLRVNTT